MKHEFRLADIGEGLEEAEIVAWLVSPGETVVRDQPIVEVMTDKSNAELPAPHAGIVIELGGNPGDIVEVGAMLAIIDDNLGDSAPTQPAGPTADVPDANAHTTTTPSAVNPVPSSPKPSTIDTTSAASAAHAGPKASPATRRAAGELGIDLRQIAGSGPGGRILMSDLLPAQADTAHAEPSPQTLPQAAPRRQTAEARPRRARSRPAVAPPQTAPPSTRELPGTAPVTGVLPLRGIRRAVARNMTESWSQIPHIHSFEHVDAQPMMELRRQLRRSGRHAIEQLTPLSFFVAAVASALRTFPITNASIDMQSETIIGNDAINIGVAVATPVGLLVPVLRNADQGTLAELTDDLHDLVGAARTGDLQRDDLQGGTATITNFGSLGGERAAPLIRPGESVIVGFGAIAERPFVVDGAVVARQTMHIVVGADHRLLDGDVVSAFIRHIAELIANPIDLVMGA